MALRSIVFDDFSGGDEGRSRPMRTNPTTFRGINVWAYPSGLGPRPPFQDLRISGLPTDTVHTLTLLRSTSFSTNKLIMTLGTTVYRASFTFGAAASSAGTVTSAPSQGLQIGDKIYFISAAGQGSRVGDTGAPADVAALPAGTSIAQVGEITVVRTLTDPVIRWSAAADPTTWDVANTVNIGAGTPIMYILTQRNTLVVLKFDGQVWVVTGVLGVNETLRQVDLADPLRSSLPAVGNGSNLWYCGSKKMVKFTGAQAIVVDRPDVPGAAGYTVKPWQVNPGSVLPLLDDDEFLLVGTLDQDADLANGRAVWACAYRKGAWTRHTVPVTYKFTGSASSQIVATNVMTCQVGYEGKAIIGTFDDDGTKLYLFESEQEYPLMPLTVVDTNNDGASGAPVVAEFKTGEVWHPEGARVEVTSVLVDYSYDPSFTPLATYSKFDLSVEALQNAGSATVRRSTTQTFVAPSSGSNPDGAPLVRGQARFQMGDQGAGVGFRVRLDDWRGIIIHRITVQVDEEAQAF